MDDVFTGHGAPGAGTLPPRPLAPLFPENRRYWPKRPFPPYRYVPGLNPHPTAHPRGHSWGREEIRSYRPPANWHENAAYLYGIDLYHQGFLWEAHECWEGLWRLVERQSAEGLFLQSLILNAAAQFKAHLGVLRGVTALSRHARECLQSVATMRGDHAGEGYMGLNLLDLLAQMDRHYNQVWSPGDGMARLVGPPPRFEPDALRSADAEVQGEGQESGGHA